MGEIDGNPVSVCSATGYQSQRFDDMDVVFQSSARKKWGRRQFLDTVGLSWQPRYLVWTFYNSLGSQTYRQTTWLVYQVCWWPIRLYGVHKTSYIVLLHWRKNGVVFFLYSPFTSSLVLSYLWRKQGRNGVACPCDCCVRCAFRVGDWLFLHSKASPTKSRSCLHSSSAKYIRNFFWRYKFITKLCMP